MDKDKAMSWVEALRSGKYLQGRQRLKHRPSGVEGPYKYCCLGVLGEINGLDERYLLEWAALPDRERGCTTLATALGEIRDYTPIFIDGVSHTCLAKANDSGVSFLRIADWIERNYEKI